MAERKPNRLINEKSPYLLQHAYNPVDWYPWGDEAFQTARRENKPIFLSIGYSTCHWCHVMERESFEDPEVARLMNEAFVNIKVDREERPDIDGVYMAACRMMSGGGGWPLTIIMTPDRKPFFAATYIPKESRFGHIGMTKLIPEIKKLWESRREEVESSAERVTMSLRRVNGAAGDELGEEVLERGFEQLSRAFDKQHGGFGRAPKFPAPHNLTFLLRYWKRSGNAAALEMVEKTLRAMRLGGIFDHVGFGFHRYSTDAEWFLPHFEKMLYDQAMLAMAYTEVYQATGDVGYETTAREIFTYVLRDMTDAGGGFYSAEDADSEGEEGKFYLWTLEEVREVLGSEEAQLIMEVFNMEEDGNFRDEATGRKTGRNILYLRQGLPEVASEPGIAIEELRQRVETAREKLFAAREKRVHPHKDDKILADWNGLMIAALAKGAQAFNDFAYTAAAERAATFICSKMQETGGLLYHRYRDGEVAVPGFLDDYAFMIWGLIELYEATFKPRYLKAALDLNGFLLNNFWDEAEGGFYFTSGEAEAVLVRQKELYDGAVPSGNSVSMLNLIRLGRLIANPGFEEKAWRLRRAFSKVVAESPGAFTQLLSAVDFAVGPAYEVVIAGNPQARDVQGMVGAVRKVFVPNKVLLLRPDGDSPEITNLAIFTKGLSSRDNKATAYVCRGYNCELPTTDVGEMLEMLNA